MNQFISKYIGDLLCVCVNDSELLPDEKHAQSSDNKSNDLSDSRSAMDNEIGSDNSTCSGSLTKGSPSAIAVAAAVDCFKEGRTAHDAEDCVQAISFFKRAIELNPKFIDAHIDLAEVYIQCMNPRLAEKHFKKVIKLDPYNYRTLYKLGYMYLNEMNRPKNAVAMFQKCLDINPIDSDAGISLGLSYMELHQYSDAIACFKDLLAENPADVVALFNLGNAYHDIEAYSDAVAQYKKVLELEKNHIDAYFNMAIAYQHLAKADAITTETRLRYLSSAMRCYVYISSLKDIISRQFAAEALKGIETVRREQMKFTRFQVSENVSSADDIAVAARCRSGSAVPPPSETYHLKYAGSSVLADQTHDLYPAVVDNPHPPDFTVSENSAEDSKRDERNISDEGNDVA